MLPEPKAASLCARLAMQSAQRKRGSRGPPEVLQLTLSSFGSGTSLHITVQLIRIVACSAEPQTHCQLRPEPGATRLLREHRKEWASRRNGDGSAPPPKANPDSEKEQCANQREVWSQYIAEHCVAICIYVAGMRTTEPSEEERERPDDAEAN